MGNDVLSLAAGIPVDGGGLLGGDSGGFLSGFGGPANLGLSILAANQPSPVRMPFGSVFGQGALGARNNALLNRMRGAQATNAELGNLMTMYQLRRLQALAPVQDQIYSALPGMFGLLGSDASSPSSASASPTAPAAAVGGSGNRTGAAPVAAYGNGFTPGQSGSPDYSPYVSADANGPAAAPGAGPPTAGPASPVASSPPSALAMPPQRRGMDPNQALRMGALMSVAGLPGGQQLEEYGKTMLQYDPDTLRAVESAKSALSVDLFNRDTALARGDQATAQMWHQKALTDSKLLNIGERNGNVTAFTGGIDPRTGLPNFVGYNPETGTINTPGGSTGIPGFAAAKGNIAAAEAQGRATADLQEVKDAQGNTYLVPKSALLANARGGGSPPLAGLGPERSGMIAENVKQAADLNETYRKQAQAGNELLPQVGQLRAAAEDFGPGKFAEARGEYLNLMNSLGIISDKEKGQLGSYQEGTKIAIQLQAAVTKQLGSREAAQIFQYMGKSMPNLTMSADGLQKVSAFLAGVSRYNIARAQYAQERMTANDSAGVNNTQTLFQNKSNPLFYVLSSASPKVRLEMVSQMPPAQQTQLYRQWDAAIKAGLAPRPGDYDGQ